MAPAGNSVWAAGGGAFLRDLLRQELRAGLFGGSGQQQRAGQQPTGGGGWRCLCADCPGAAKGLLNRPGNTKCHWCCRVKSKARNPPAASRVGTGVGPNGRVATKPAPDAEQQASRRDSRAGARQRKRSAAAAQTEAASGAAATAPDGIAAGLAAAAAEKEVAEQEPVKLRLDPECLAQMPALAPALQPLLDALALERLPAALSRVRSAEEVVGDLLGQQDPGVGSAGRKDLEARIAGFRAAIAALGAAGDDVNAPLKAKMEADEAKLAKLTRAAPSAAAEATARGVPRTSAHQCPSQCARPSQ